MAKYKLAASVRNQTGKEAAKKLRAAKKLPAVFYGPEAAPVHLVVETSDLKGILKQTPRDSAIIGLEMTSKDGGTKQATVMIKELQSDNLKGEYLHADFYEISMDKEITALNAAALSNKLLQYANGAIYDEDRNVHEVHDLKLDAAEEIIEDADGKPVLIGWTYQHGCWRWHRVLT